MAKPSDVDLAEYNQMRGELNSRTQLGYGLLAIDLTALAAGMGLFGKLPGVNLGLAMVSILLWFVWMDHCGQIYKIATYIALRLAPRLGTPARPVLGWERFLREIDQGSEATVRALFGPAARGRITPRTFSVSWYMTGLFGGIPLLLLALQVYSTGRRPLWLVAVAALVALWGAAAWQFRRYVRFVTYVEKAIVQAAPPPGPPPPQPPAPVPPPAPGQATP